MEMAANWLLLSLPLALTFTTYNTKTLCNIKILAQFDSASPVTSSVAVPLHSVHPSVGSSPCIGYPDNLWSFEAVVFFDLPAKPETLDSLSYTYDEAYTPSDLIADGAVNTYVFPKASTDDSNTLSVEMVTNGSNKLKPVAFDLYLPTSQHLEGVRRSYSTRYDIVKTNDSISNVVFSSDGSKVTYTLTLADPTQYPLVYERQFIEGRKDNIDPGYQIGNVRAGQ